MDAQLQGLAVEIAKLDLKPGNSLVVSVPVGTSSEAVARLQTGIRRMLGESQRFIIVTDEIKFTVLAESDREDETRA
jgi:hypothetical protein